MQRAFRIGYATALILFIISGALVYRSTKHLLDINRLVEHSQQVLRRLELIQNTRDELTSSTRGYARAGDSADLDRYTSARRDMTQLLGTGLSLNSDNPERQRGIQELDAKMRESDQYWEGAIAMHKRGDSRGAQDLMSLERPLQLIRDSRQIIVSMIEDEQRVLADRSREAEASARRAFVIEAVLAIAVLVILVTSFLFVQMDLNQKAQAEEQLRKSKDAAEAANRAKSTFLANMSHEIRTPMNGILGMTELVLDTDLTAEQRENLGLVRLSAESLLSIINDILDFSKIEAGRMELESIPFDLRESLGETMKSLAFRAHQKGLELVYEVQPDAPEALLGDPGRIRQLLINVVGNAIKFTQKGEVFVQVQEESADAGATCLHFSVKDTGVGIPADKQEKIFEAFSQADGSMSRKYGGTGLGLAICVRLVALMGGKIWVESQPGQGSTFHFTARLALEEASSPRPVPLEPEQLRDLHVLVVDDNFTNRRVLSGMLIRWGMKPTLVERGEAALRALEIGKSTGHRFPLILLDGQMPGMDGFGLAEQIKRDPQLVGATIMMLTSVGQLGDAARCRELGISAYLVKPIRQGELLEAICSVLNQVSQERIPLVTRHSLREEKSRLRVLLAEDNPVNLTLAVRLLEKRGYIVSVARDGREALAALENREFDLVLMDIQMPEMDGLEATMAIREKEQRSGKHLPIIAMTAHALKGDEARCLAAGMDAYISKPIRTYELFATIQSVVKAYGESHPGVAPDGGTVGAELKAKG